MCRLDKYEKQNLPLNLGYFETVRIFNNIFFKAFWPLCKLDKQGNQLPISHLKYHQWDLIGLKWPTKNQYHKHLMGNYHQDFTGDHHCMHVNDIYKIHNIEAAQTLEFFLGWENFLDYNDPLFLYEKWH